MSIESVFYAQVASIVVFVFALFGIYRLLVESKDGVIQLLNFRIQDRDARIKELESQTPDALATALSSRIEISVKEVARLREDGDKHAEEIKAKEGELQALKDRLGGLLALIKETDLICNKCGAPLSQRVYHTVHGFVGGRDVDVEVECTEYECGRSLNDGVEKSQCRV